MKRLAVVIVVGLALAASRAEAHPLDIGYLRIENTAAEVKVALDVDVDAATTVLAVDAATLDAASLSARAPALAAATHARAPIVTDAGPCIWGAATATRSDRTITVTQTATCPAAGVRHWSFPFVEQTAISPTFELMVSASGLGGERLTLVDKQTRGIELGAESVAAAPPPPRPAVDLHSFVWSGIEHIGVAPGQWLEPDGSLRLPDGIDHIVFLLALLLAGGSLLQLIGIASGFTLGHSVTLALAALDVVRPPASIIEPLIALTIALSAVEAFTGRWKEHRWKIATGFGLIHGFGFAFALTRLELSTGDKVTALFGYNLGVELGQIVIVLLAAPLVLLLYRRPQVATHVVRTVAAGIFGLGLYWFVTRAFF